ncbi:MAG: SIMPL domain-containing protein [Ignavibacteria bacterium]|nr:SIMPL domain-containing protein [Ignavibacteria bacterium]
MKTVILIIFSIVVSAMIVMAQGPPDLRRAIVIEGEAEAIVIPDRASVMIGVETEGSDVLTIKRDNDKRVKTLYSALKELGIPERDIQTSDLQIHPQYDFSMGKRTLLKYMMRNVVYVTVRDLSKIDKVINTAVSGGVNILDNVSFSLSTAKQIRDSLRIEAVKDAMVKASALASAAGAKAGRVMSIEEEDSNPAPYPMNRSNATVQESGSASGTDVSAGHLTIQVKVNVRVGIE